MKANRFFLFFLFFLFCSLSIQVASAGNIGMGIKWNTESEIVKDDSQYCVTYMLYNPSDTDVNGYLVANGAFENIFTADPAILVPKGTNSTNALPTKICFNITKIYKESCVAGLFCQRQCPVVTDPTDPFQGFTRIKGEVVAKYTSAPNGASGGTGSLTGASGAVPLELIVQCQPKQRNNTLMYASFVVILIALILILWLIKKMIGKKRK